MPGRTTGDNKFGPSPWVVGLVLGNGCNYTLIQDAINDASAAGGSQLVQIHPGTYTEDLVFANNVNLQGVDNSGVLGSVIVIGNHSYTGSGRFGFAKINFRVPAGAGDIFSFTASGGTLITGFSQCDINAAAVAGAQGVVINASAFTTGFNCSESRILGNDDCMEFNGPVTMFWQRGTCTSTNGAVINSTVVVNLRYEASFARSINSSPFIVFDGSTFFLNQLQIEAAQEAITIGVGATVQNTNCTIDSNAGSGFYVSGTGSYNYSDISNSGSAIAIDPGLAASTQDWKPYSIETPSPGTGATRGTACFNEDHFDVVDGFVSANAAGLPYYSLTPYIVGPDVHSEFSTISAAITQAVADGASSANQKNVYVKPQSGGYTENIDIPDGVNVISLVATALSNLFGGPEPLPVLLNGTVTFSSGFGRLVGFSIFSDTSNSILVGEVSCVVNNCMIADSGSVPYVIEFTGTNGAIFIEGSSFAANAVFITNQAGSFNIFGEDSNLSGFTAASQLADNSQIIVELRYSQWYGAINGGVGTSGAFRCHYSQISDALGGALIIAENASLIGTYCLFDAGSAFLLDSTTVGNFEMHHCRFSPFAFTATQANINSMVVDQSSVLQVATGGTTELFRPTSANVFRGTYSERFIVNIQTTDATPTPILTIPLLDPEAVAVFGEVQGFDATFNGALSGPVNGSARRNGGAAVFVADQSSPAQEGTLGVASFTVAASGNDLVVNVVGVALTTVNWSADFKVLHMQTDT